VGHGENSIFHSYRVLPLSSRFISKNYTANNRCDNYSIGSLAAVRLPYGWYCIFSRKFIESGSICFGFWHHSWVVVSSNAKQMILAPIPHYTRLQAVLPLLPPPPAPAFAARGCSTARATCRLRSLCPSACILTLPPFSPTTRASLCVRTINDQKAFIYPITSFLVRE
jgi:hypothetical protein